MDHQTSAPLLGQLWEDHRRFLLGLAELFQSLLQADSRHITWDILNLGEQCLILVSREAIKPLSLTLLYSPVSESFLANAGYLLAH